MKLQKISGGVVMGVHVKPNSKQFRVAVEFDELVVFCREAPVKGRVNRELIKKLSRGFFTEGLRSFWGSVLDKRRFWSGILRLRKLTIS